MQPEADSRSYTLGGFVQDKINFDLDSHNFAIIPGVRVVHQSTKPENLSDLAANSSVLTRIVGGESVRQKQRYPGFCRR